MVLGWSRYTALVFALGLGIGEAVINWGHWQFAPLWIVDYICVLWLLTGFYQTRRGKHIATLLSGWAFTAAVFYMALFINLDPELTVYLKPDRTITVDRAYVGNSHAGHCYCCFCNSCAEGWLMNLMTTN